MLEQHLALTLERLALPVSSVLFAVVLVILPFGVFRPLRGIVGVALRRYSYVLAFSVWLFSCLITFIYWGWIGLLAGLAICGLGVVPVALLASVFNDAWGLSGQFVLMCLEVLVARLLAEWFEERYRDWPNRA